MGQLLALVFPRWPLTAGIAAPPGPTSAAHDSLHVAGPKETRCHELLEGGRVRRLGDGHGSRAAHAQAQDAA